MQHSTTQKIQTSNTINQNTSQIVNGDIPARLGTFIREHSKRLIQGYISISIRDTLTDNIDPERTMMPVEIFAYINLGQIHLHWITHAKDYNNPTGTRPLTTECSEEFNFVGNFYASNGVQLFGIDDSRSYEALNRFTNWLDEMISCDSTTTTRSPYGPDYIASSNPGVHFETKFLIVPTDEYTADQLSCLAEHKMPHFSGEKALRKFLATNEYKHHVFSTVQDLLEELNDDFDRHNYSHFTQISLNFDTQ